MMINLIDCMNIIFFYANIRTYDFTLGITRKVYSEIDAFRKQGYQVYYSGYLKDGVAIFDNHDQIVYQKNFLFKNDSLNHFFRRGILMNLCISFMKKTDFGFDFSFVRYHFFDRKYVSLLKALKSKSGKVVIEAHSTPKFPKDLSIMRYIGIKDSIWNKYAKRYVCLVASMSDEENLWGIPVVKISNGIDVSTIRLHNYNGNKEDINLIAVSFESPVHGYDRVLNGIDYYYKNGGSRQIYFHIVGTTLGSTDNLIKKLGLENRCIKYGPQKGKELDDIYDKCNIGVGCLANHRIGSQFGSALKTKEYIAKGIPFVYGWKEKVLESFKYGLSVELNDTPLDMESVISFYDSLPKEGLPLLIRGHLGEEDTWSYQIKKVINGVNTISSPVIK